MRKCKVCGYTCEEKYAQSWVKYDVCSMSCVRRIAGKMYRRYRNLTRRIK